MRNAQKQPFYHRLSLTLLSLVLIVVILRSTKEILSPVAFGFLFALLLLPVAQFLEKLRCSRGLAATLAVLMFVICMLGLFYFISWQTTIFLSDLPTLEKNLLMQANQLTIWIDGKFNITSEQQVAWINETAAKSISTVSAFAMTTLSSISALLLFIVFIPLYTFFLLFYRRLLVQFLLKLFRPAYERQVHEVITQTRVVVKSYIVGLFIEMVVVAALYITVLLVLGVKYAVLLGTIGAIFNVIPYIGMVITVIITLLVTLTTGTLSLALYASLGLFLVHLLDANVLLPRIVGSKVSINAMITLLGVFVGSMVWGVAGMFISIPAMALLKIIFERVPHLKPWGILMGSGE